MKTIIELYNPGESKQQKFETRSFGRKKKALARIGFYFSTLLVVDLIGKPYSFTS